MQRIISLIDMDCFYAQVEQREQPSLWGKPVIVVQHSRQGVEGGILAVSYEARIHGIKRGMSVADAKKQCSDLNVCHVPIGEYADKADIQKYRDASAEVFKVLNNFDSSIIVEKASVDEAFLDMTAYVDKTMEAFENSGYTINDHLAKLSTTHVANGKDTPEQNRQLNLQTFLYDAKSDREQWRLIIAAVTVEQIRIDIWKQTEFHCSAGIGNNKMMAKLVCARHKPRQQTLVPFGYSRTILQTTNISDVRGFGGKLGQKIKDELQIEYIGDLLFVDYSLLIESFPDQHEWLRLVAEGYDDEPVRPRAESSSIAVSKNFPGREAIKTVDEMRSWIVGLTKELAKRLAIDQTQNNRTAENLVYALQAEGGMRPQKTLKITSYHPDKLFDQVWKVLKPMNRSGNEISWYPKCVNISLCATRFAPGVPAENRAITEWLHSKEKKYMRDTLGIQDEVLILEEIKVSGPSTSKSSAPKSNDDVIVLDDSDDEVGAPPAPTEPLRDDSDWITIDGKRVLPKLAFQRLPPHVKKQYQHRMALESARLLKANHANKSTKKRQGNLNEESKSKKSKTRQIDSFFNKKS